MKKGGGGWLWALTCVWCDSSKGWKGTDVRGHANRWIGAPEERTDANKKGYRKLKLRAEAEVSRSGGQRATRWKNSKREKEMDYGNLEEAEEEQEIRLGQKAGTFSEGK